ncbi:MAG: FkbW [uncultured Rubrobacteraceae bacterium]|uniref:FkbW n=1 Tax=uncultured Rubrobacteraceae bacterium TaxID=349277 RepID=A0A6J4R5A8_9ACTN|nr:MAG: FkbW [uncultured Rubrobacteraceae bacterium]
MKFESSPRDVRPLFVCLSLVFAVLTALAILLSVVPITQAQTANCPKIDSLQVPGAEKQEEFCLDDLTTEGLVDGVTTDRQDWDNGALALHALGTVNPRAEEPIPGIQINGCFPDDSDTNTNIAGGCEHDSQFVIRLPNEWNGKLLMTGPSGNREQYANDFIFSDYFLARDYAYAMTDKGNTGNRFYEDGERPGDAVAEWHERVEQITRATKPVVKQRYGKAPKKTYITGISNGGYLTRYALENTPQLYDGGVDWEGTLFRAEGPNLFTYLPTSLAEYPGPDECRTSAPDFDDESCDRMRRAGFQPGSEFLWEQHYNVFWDLTQRIFREEFDPLYDGVPEEEENGVPGTPLCQDETSPPPPCDADYVYEDRPQSVKDAVGRVQNTGKIGKPMITLHSTLDALLPIDTDSNPYRQLIKDAGKGSLHRYYKIEEGNHVDRFYNNYPPEEPTELRPILPCHRASFEALEKWVEKDRKPPKSKMVANPGGPDVINNCDVGKGARYNGLVNATGG